MPMSHASELRGKVGVCRLQLTCHRTYHCVDFYIVRQNLYIAFDLKDLFHNIHFKQIISFVRAVGLNKINFKLFQA